MPRRSSIVARLGAVLALALSAACAASTGTVAVGVEPPPRFAPSQKMTLRYRDGHSVVLRGVQVTHDSVSGVPVPQSPSCDSCRVAVAVAEIADATVTRDDRNTMLLLAAPFAFVGLLFLLGPGMD